MLTGSATRTTSSRVHPVIRAVDHFDRLGPFWAIDCRAANDLTRALLGWQPTHLGLIDDLEAGHYV